VVSVIGISNSELQHLPYNLSNTIAPSDRKQSEPLHYIASFLLAMNEKSAKKDRMLVRSILQIIAVLKPELDFY